MSLLTTLGLHHVNETVPPDEWIYWDLGFLLWGVAMRIGGWALVRATQERKKIPTEAGLRKRAPSHRPLSDPAADALHPPGAIRFNDHAEVTASARLGHFSALSSRQWFHFDTRTMSGSNPNEVGWLSIRVEKPKLIIVAVKCV